MTAAPHAVRALVRAGGAGTNVIRLRPKSDASPPQGLAGTGPSGPRVDDPAEDIPLAPHAQLICEVVRPALAESGRSLVLAAPDGLTGWILVTTAALRGPTRCALPGEPWAGTGAGARAIQAAVRSLCPVTVRPFGPASRAGASWSCTACPVFDPVGGELLGVIALAGPSEALGAECAGLIRAAAHLVASDIARVGCRETVPQPDITLRLLGPRPPEATVVGRSIPLTQRRADLLALLARHPEGMSADALADQLYGDAGQPGTVRAEVHRIRRELGGRLASDPYRFSAPVTSDAERVETLLRWGDVRGAVRAYTGQLLPRSDLLGIELLRRELHEAVRSAAMTVGGDALVDYCEGAPGESDLEAWQRLLARTVRGGVERAMVTAHVERLRQVSG